MVIEMKSKIFIKILRGKYGRKEGTLTEELRFSYDGKQLKGWHTWIFRSTLIGQKILPDDQASVHPKSAESNNAGKGGNSALSPEDHYLI